MTAASTAAIDAQVLQIVADLTVVPLAQIRPEHDFRADLGMDSVSSMELLSIFAEEFDIDIDIDEAVKVTTVGGLLDIARAKLANAS